MSINERKTKKDLDGKSITFLWLWKKLQLPLAMTHLLQYKSVHWEILALINVFLWNQQGWVLLSCSPWHIALVYFCVITPLSSILLSTENDADWFGFFLFFVVVFLLLNCFLTTLYIYLRKRQHLMNTLQDSELWKHLKAQVDWKWSRSLRKGVFLQQCAAPSCRFAIDTVIADKCCKSNHRKLIHLMQPPLDLLYGIVYILL